MEYYYNGEWHEISLKSADTIPVGAIIEYPSLTAPYGYLLCDGRAVSRTEYADLFAVIGTTHGAGDGSTTFNLPTRKGKVAVGQDSSQTEFDTIGETGGSKTHTHKYGLNYTSYYQDVILEGNSDAGILNFDSAGNKTPTGQGTIVKQTGPYTVNAGNATGTASSGNAVYTYQQLANTEYKSSLQPYQVSAFYIKYTKSIGVLAKTKNETTTSQEDAYSCNYVNNLITDSNSSSSVKSYSCNYINSINTYSSSERFTGKTYVDGKGIYTKTIQTTTYGTYTENGYTFTWVSSQDINANIDTMVDVTFNIKALNRQLNASSTSVSIEYLNDGRLQIGVVSALINTSCPLNITIYYTKTS